jgi:hypothetical protein
MVKTWRYSSLKEFEQTMFYISEISRIYSLCSLKNIECVTFHIYTIQKYICFTRFTELRTFTSDITFKICIKYVFINNLFHFDVIQQ